MLTYLDSGVLIAAAKGNEALSARAMAIISDPSRTFISSPFLRIETLHRTEYEGYQDQADFHRAFLSSAAVLYEDSQLAVSKAEEIAASDGVDALDAMHVAVAILASADEIITTENITRPFYRASRLIAIRHLSTV